MCCHTQLEQGGPHTKLLSTLLECSDWNIQAVLATEMSG
jgi:hypothetical protein